MATTTYIKDIDIISGGSTTSYLIEPALYGAASTNDSGSTYTVTMPAGFTLITGATIQVKFAATNAANATLKVNTLDAKSIYYNGAQIAANTFKANHIYTLVYDNSSWHLTGDIDTNTQRPIGTGANDAAAGNHGHGNISNGGALSTANQAVVTDGSNKITTEDLSSSTPAASGTATAFVTGVTQNAKGKLTSITKANLPTASDSVAGITKLGATGGAATYGHTHGNINNNGTIGSANAIRAVVTNASNQITTDNFTQDSPVVPTSGTTTSLEFIDTVSQGASGKITATKKKIPNVSKDTAGLAPKGAAVSTQSQSTKFLREDGSWAIPSYTENTDHDTKVTQTGVTDNQELSILLKNTNNTTDETTSIKYGKTNDKLVTVNPSSGKITAPGGLAGNASSATKVSVTNTTPTAATSYYITAVASTTSGNQSLINNELLRVYLSANGGSAYLNVGSTSKLGGITLHSGNGFYGNIVTDTLTTSNKTYTLPNKTGTVALTSDIPTTMAWSNITGADDLKAIEALTGTSGLLKKTAANTWTLDTTAYATQTTVNGLLAAADAMIFKGTLGTGGTITAVPDGTSGKEYQAGYTYKIITAGTYANIVCEVGDLLIAISDSTSGQTAVNNAHWTVAQTNIDGAVTGPSSATGGNIPLFDGDTGKIIKNSSYSPSSFAAASHGLHVPTLLTENSTTYFLRGDNNWSNTLTGNLTVDGLINNWKFTKVTSLNANDVRTTNGLWACQASITNAAHTNHSLLLGVASVGTPFQIQIPDSSVMYIYKRYYSSGTWSGWSKISAGKADNADVATRLSSQDISETTTATNLNDLKDSNFTIYFAGGSNTVTNNPLTNGTAFGLHVYRNASGYRVQDYVSSGGIRLTRIWNNSSWSDWEHIVRSANTATGNSTQPVYIDADGKAQVCTAYANATVAAAGKATNDSDGNAINITYLKKSGGTMTGTINRYYSSASVEPMITLRSTNLDVYLFRVGHATSETGTFSNNYALLYNGVGGSPDNYLYLQASTASTTTNAIRINENGLIYFGNTDDATATDSAAFTIAGGMGIAKKLYVGGPVMIGSTDAAANTGYATANSGSTNYIGFYGVNGDGPGTYNHSYIGESIYGAKTSANEKSELLLYHGNDPTTSSGLDRIRLFAASVDIQVYTSSMAYTAGAATWNDIRAYAGTQVANFTNGKVTITGNVLPEATNTRDLGSSSVKWANVYATTFTGNLTGNVTGNCSGTAGGVAWGNVSSRPTSIALTGAVTATATTLGDGAISITTTVNHGHGYISSTGQITETHQIASGDRLIVTDSANATSADKNKLIATTIAFDGSTVTKALTQKGTWETFNNYSHPTGDGNLHVPANGTGNNGKFLQATATAGSYQWASVTKSTVGLDNVTNDKQLPIAGGTLTGAINTANNTWNKIGDDIQLGDINEAGTLGIQGLNGSTAIRFTTYNQTTKTTGGKITWDGTKFIITSTTPISASISGNAATATSATSAASATDATNATNDEDGNSIKDTYTQRYIQTVDLTTDDTNTWYPVCIAIPKNGMHRISSINQLDGLGKPTWASHNSGYTAVIEMLVLSGGWGTTGAQSICLLDTVNWLAANEPKPIGYSQFGNSSYACFWCRGGAKYKLLTDFIGTWTVYRESTTVSNQTIAPRTSNPGIGITRSTITANISHANAANLTSTKNAIAYYSDVNGTFASKASANGALYATEANGALSWGTLPVAQGGTGQTSIANIQAGKDSDGNAINTTYVKKAGDTMSGKLEILYTGDTANNGPYLTVQYNNDRYSTISRDNYGLNLIKFGRVDMDNYLGTCLDTSKTLTGKNAYAFHTANTNSFSWVTTSWTEVMNLDIATRTLSIRGTGNYGGYINLIGKFNTANLKSKDTDRPGMTIAGYYPQICMIAGGVNNARHGASLVLAGYDGATATSGAFKAFAFGTPGQEVTWMDLGYGTSDNPHGEGIDAYQGMHIMRWKSDGSVGIGTREPDGKLHVYSANNNATTEQTPTLKITGKILIQDNVTGGGTKNSILNILYNGSHEYGIPIKIHSYGNDSPAIRFSHSSSADELNTQVNTNWSVGMYYNTTDKFAITRNRGTSGWGTADLVIDSSGNVGIGTTTPGYRLDVNGSINTSGILYITNANAGAIQMTRSGGPAWIHSTANVIAFCANSASLTSANSALRIGLDTVDGYNNNYAHLGSSSVQWKDVHSYKYIVEEKVTLQWNATDQSLDFVFA